MGTSMRLDVNPPLQRAQAFVRYKMHCPEMYIHADQLVAWLLEYEDILHTSEREMRELLFEHMKTCNKPLLLRIDGITK